jgi:hypothetical protein
MMVFIAFITSLTAGDFLIALVFVVLVWAGWYITNTHLDAWAMNKATKDSQMLMMSKKQKN